MSTCAVVREGLPDRERLADVLPSRAPTTGAVAPLPSGYRNTAPTPNRASCSGSSSTPWMSRHIWVNDFCELITEDAVVEHGEAQPRDAS